MKARIIKDYKSYKEGNVIDLTPNELHGLIELGVAQIDKMLDASQYKIVNPKKKIISASSVRRKK